MHRSMHVIFVVLFRFQYLICEAKLLAFFAMFLNNINKNIFKSISSESQHQQKAKLKKYV